MKLWQDPGAKAVGVDNQGSHGYTRAWSWPSPCCCLGSHRTPSVCNWCLPLLRYLRPAPTLTHTCARDQLQPAALLSWFLAAGYGDAVDPQNTLPSASGEHTVVGTVEHRAGAEEGSCHSGPGVTTCTSTWCPVALDPASSTLQCPATRRGKSSASKSVHKVWKGCLLQMCGHLHNATGIMKNQENRTPWKECNKLPVAGPVKWRSRN